MKPAFSYYGGKQRIVSKIIPHIPQHTVFVEPFCGGATVFFAKPWPNVGNTGHYREVINDTNGDVVNFFRVLQDPDTANELIRRLSFTPYSHEEHRRAKNITTDDPVERAWAFYVNVQMSFANQPGCGWGFNKCGRNSAGGWLNRHKLGDYVQRMDGVFIENVPALDCIRKWDSPQTFFYCDPPYPKTNQGHYGGYTAQDFQDLVDTLDQCDGSFILSNYHQPEATIPDDWQVVEIETRMSAAHAKDGTRGKRTEVLWIRDARKPVRPSLQKLYDAGKFDCFRTNRAQQMELLHA